MAPPLGMTQLPSVTDTWASCLSLQTYSQLAHPIQQAKALGLQFHSRILDISNVDVSHPKGRDGQSEAPADIACKTARPAGSQYSRCARATD